MRLLQTSLLNVEQLVEGYTQLCCLDYAKILVEDPSAAATPTNSVSLSESSAAEAPSYRCLALADLSEQGRRSLCGSSEELLGASEEGRGGQEDEVISQPKVLPIRPDPVFFHPLGLLRLAVFYSMMLLEYHYVYDLSAKKEECNWDQNILRIVDLFVLRCYPLTTTSVLGSIVLGSIGAWWGIFFTDRFQFASDALHGLLSLGLASFLSFFTINLLTMRKYLPHSVDQWKKALVDGKWWLWIISRIWGMRDYLSISIVLTWVFTWAIAFWPLRYLFYYRQFTFHGYASNFVDGHERLACDVFFINLIGQSVWMAFLLFYGLAVIIFLPILSAKEEADGLLADGFSPILIMRRLYEKFIGWGRNHRIVPFLFFSAIVNLLVIVLRFLYFFFTHRSTWYSWWVVGFGLLTFHVVITIGLVMVSEYLVQRHELEKKFRDVFVKEMLNAAMNAMQPRDNEKQKNEEAGTEQDKQDGQNRDYEDGEGMDEEERECTRKMAHSIFQRVLERSVLYGYLSPSGNQQREQREGENDNADSSQSGKEDAAKAAEGHILAIFHALLQTEAFALRRQYSEGVNEEACCGEEEEDGGAGVDDSDASVRVEDDGRS